MAGLIGTLLGLYIMYRVIKYALSLVGLELNSLLENNFSSFIFRTISFIFKPFTFLFSSSLNSAKHEGFMGWFGRFFILNRFHEGLLLDGKNDRISLKNSFTHSIIVANTGRGKTSSFVIPNIFTLDNCSILTTDLSGELYLKTSGRMKQRGFEIKAINLADFNKSDTFNPLESVKTDSDILEVVEILISSSGMKNEDPFWNNGAKTILLIVISCLVNQREKEGTREFCNLANVRYLLNNFGKNGEGLTNFVAKYGSHQVLNNFKGFISGSEKTTQGFITTALNCLFTIGIDSIARITSSNEINFEEIRAKKTIVYLIIPQHELHTYSFLLNLFYARFFKTCFENKSSDVLPVYCLLDEAGHTKIPSLSTIITTIRKYKVSISLIFQSLSQLETQYGKHDSETIIGGGVNSKIFFSGCDENTCEKLSRVMGNITTHNKQGKLIQPLMTPQEIRMMGDKEALYLFSNKKPMLLKTRPYFESLIFSFYSKIEPFAKENRILPQVRYANID
jgi:type IV secretory pathway TraG/TraD family ATPase VirD4